MSPIKKISIAVLVGALAFAGLATYRYIDLNKRITDIKKIQPTATNSFRIQIEPGLLSAKVVYSYETASPLFLKVVETGTVHYGLGYIFTGNVTGDFEAYLEHNSKRISETPVAKSQLVFKSNNDLIETGVISAVPEKMQEGSYQVSLTNNLSRLDAVVNPGTIHITNNGSEMTIEKPSLALGLNIKNWTDSVFKLNVAKFQMTAGTVENIKLSMHDEKNGTKRNFFTDLSANSNFTQQGIPEAYRKVDVDFSAAIENVAETPYLLLIQLMQNKDSIEPELFKTKVMEFSRAIISSGMTVSLKKAFVKTSGGDIVDVNAVLNLPVSDTTAEDWSNKVSGKMNFNLKGGPADFIKDFSGGAFAQTADAEKFSIGYKNSEVQFNDKTATPEQMVLIRRLVGFLQIPK